MTQLLAVLLLVAPVTALADSSHCYNIKASDLKAQCLAGATR